MLKRVFTSLIVLLAMASINLKVNAAGKASSKTRSIQQIRTVLTDQVAAWNRGDLEGFMKGYWNSPNLSFYSGSTITKGWQETLARYRKSYQAEEKEMGKLEFTNLQIELLGSENAFVRGNWHLTFSNRESGGTFTLILKRFKNGWKVIHDHTG